MAKWLIPLTALAAGVCLFAGGLLYGVLTVGVPTPDAPPSVAAQEHRDFALSAMAMDAGLVVFSLGGVGLAGVTIVQVARRRTSEAEHS